MTRPKPPSRYVRTNHPPKEGAYGTVEVWHDKLLDRNVAIKWLSSPEGEEQLLNEWKFLAQRMSRHVVEIYELIFDQHGVLFGIVLEHIDGVALSEAGAATSAAQVLVVLRLLFQLATGIADLHEAPVVHRDIKPQNAVVGEDGRLKIVDFGLSAAMDSSTTTRARGTFGYLAPEMFVRPSVVTPAVDVYAFGLTTWSTLTGQLPNVGRHGMPDRAKFPLPSIASAVTLPAKLAPVIDSCLRWEPRDRPAMRDVADAIHAELIKDQHQASISVSTGTSEINSTTPRRSIKTGVGNLSVSYDGYAFSVERVEGEVFINNVAASVGAVLSEGCLITFGNVGRGAARAHAPFRQFTPEVVV